MSAARAHAAGVELAYEEAGSGPPALLIHGSGLTRLCWRETVAALGGELRTLAYDRRGYGESEAPDIYTGTTIEEQAEDAAALLDHLGAAPALVCGHSAGAVIALDLLLRHPGLVGSAVLIEPPLLSLSPSGAEALGELRAAMEAAAREGGAEAAVEAFVATRHGPEAAAALGAERLDAVRGSARAALAEFGAVSAWQFTRGQLRSIERPLAVVRGERCAPVYGEVAAAVAAAIPGARLLELDAGGAAMLEDPAGVAAALRELAAPEED